MPETALPARRVPLLGWVLVPLSVAGFAAIWALLALVGSTQASWMAVIGALDIAWMLRLSGWPAGGGRMLAGVLGTGVAIVLTQWIIIATQLGSVLGLKPWESMLRLGFDHAWTLAQIANGATDLAWLAAAVVVAALVSR